MDAHLDFASDSAILISFNSKKSEKGVHRRIYAVTKRLEAERLPILNLHPAYQSLLVDFDPAKTDPHELLRVIGDIVAQMPEEGAGEMEPHDLVEIPVFYGGENGPDLAALADELGLSESEIIKHHTGAEYEVAFLGFAPGFAYLSGMDPRLKAPRRKSPRLKVPAGSVGIAGLQTGVYPEESPGGWQIIGRTDLKLFDPIRDRPSILKLGDRVRFVEAHLWKESPEKPFVAREEITMPPGEPTVEVISGGLFSTIQDLGRIGWAHFGVSRGGAADPVSLRLANRLVGNKDKAAAIEMTVMGGSFRFLRDAWIAVTGSECSPRLDGEPLSMWTSFPVRAGQVLSMGPIEGGLRAYLAIGGGVDVPKLMGSRSTFVGGGWGGFLGRELQSGDILRVFSSREAIGGYRRVRSTVRDWFQAEAHSTVRAIRGPQWNWFSDEAQHLFFSQEFLVTSEADRRGIRLEGTPLKWATQYQGEELVTEGVAAGSVQVPSGGQALVLYCEQQTAGGYPKVATVASADLFRLGQVKPGSRLRFIEVSLEEAWQLVRERERELESAILPI